MKITYTHSWGTPMANLHKIEDRKYIRNLFKNLFHHKEIPATIQFQNTQSAGMLVFNPLQENELHIVYSNELEMMIVTPQTEIEIRFFYKEILY